MGYGVVQDHAHALVVEAHGFARAGGELEEIAAARGQILGHDVPHAPAGKPVRRDGAEAFLGHGVGGEDAAVQLHEEEGRVLGRVQDGPGRLLAASQLAQGQVAAASGQGPDP